MLKKLIPKWISESKLIIVFNRQNRRLLSNEPQFRTNKTTAFLSSAFKGTLKVLCYTWTGFSLVHFIPDTIGYPARVNGKSMSPTLNPPIEEDYSHIKNNSLKENFYFSDDWVYISTFSTVKYFPVDRGEVVAAVSPKDSDDR